MIAVNVLTSVATTMCLGSGVRGAEWVHLEQQQRYFFGKKSIASMDMFSSYQDLLCTR